MDGSGGMYLGAGLGALGFFGTVTAAIFRFVPRGSKNGVTESLCISRRETIAQQLEAIDKKVDLILSLIKKENENE